jgi:hypothetical protein
METLSIGKDLEVGCHGLFRGTVAEFPWGDSWIPQKTKNHKNLTQDNW